MFDLWVSIHTIHSYESKASQLAKQKESSQKRPGIPGGTFVETATASAKSAVKDKQSQQSTPAQASGSGLSTINQLMSNIQISSKITSEQIEAEARSKQIRKLKKQLREIEAIEEKTQAAGGEHRLEKEQLDKLKRREAIVDELAALGEDVA